MTKAVVLLANFTEEVVDVDLWKIDVLLDDNDGDHSIANKTTQGFLWESGYVTGAGVSTLFNHISYNLPTGLATIIVVIDAIVFLIILVIIFFNIKKMQSLSPNKFITVLVIIREAVSSREDKAWLFGTFPPAKAKHSTDVWSTENVT